MSDVCSVCMLKSPIELTPIFTKNGNYWQSTGLSRMIEIVLGKKILEGYESVLAICTKCNYKISKAFYEKNVDETINISEIWADEFVALVSDINTKSCQKKISPAKELELNKLKRTYSVLVDEEEASRRKKLKTTEERKIIKFEVEVEEKKDYINCLPLECIAEIFMYLTFRERIEMDKVCQRWQDASEIAWGHIKELNLFHLDVDDSKEHESIQLMEQILSRCGRFVKKLDTIDFKSLKILPVINNYCHNLEKLDISVDEKMDENDFNNAFSQLEVLKKLSICINHSGDLSTNFAHFLSSVTENIEKIYLGNIAAFSSQILNNVLFAPNRFTVLKCISLHWLNLNEHALAGISQVKTLVKLKITSCHFESNAVVTSDLSNLQVLKWQYNTDDSLSLMSIASHCKNLKKIILILPDHLSVTAVNELKKLKQLEHFSLHYRGNDDNDLIGLPVGGLSHNLIHLELAQNSVDFGFQDVSNFKNLEHLNVQYLKKIDDDSFSSIAVNCKKLKYLNLSGCTGINNSGLQKIGNLINLEFLDIRDIQHVNDSVIFSIINNCVQMKKLSLYNLNNISKSALTTLAQLKDLENLNVAFMNNVNDGELSAIARSCKKLQELNVRACNISDTAIQELIDNCPNLESLDVRQTKITEDTLRFAVEKTKIRSNGIVLEMIINYSLSPYFKLDQRKSRFLIFNYS